MVYSIPYTRQCTVERRLPNSRTGEWEGSKGAKNTQLSTVAVPITMGAQRNQRVSDLAPKLYIPSNLNIDLILCTELHFAQFLSGGGWASPC